MPREIIVEFPSSLTDEEKKMIYGYKGEVVRCKDCKHREVQVDGVFRYEICGIRSEIINLDGYCHMGKRREDAEH